MVTRGVLKFDCSNCYSPSRACLVSGVTSSKPIFTRDFYVRMLDVTSTKGGSKYQTVHVRGFLRQATVYNAHEAHLSALRPSPQTDHTNHVACGHFVVVVLPCRRRARGRVQPVVRRATSFHGIVSGTTAARPQRRPVDHTSRSQRATHLQRSSVRKQDCDVSYDVSFKHDICGLEWIVFVITSFDRLVTACYCGCVFFHVTNCCSFVFLLLLRLSQSGSERCSQSCCSCALTSA